jgi:heme oxygenase
MKTIQETLKEHTAELHEKAESHPLMKGFIEGNYKKVHLFQYLLNLRPLYETVEQRLIIQDIHKNFDLCRSRLISKDISLLYREGIINDDNLDALNLKKSVCDWVANQWTVESTYLISDFYVRWLADLYGGRVFAKSLAPYVNTYQCNDVKKAITEVREIINKAEVDPNIVKFRANAFFEFHIDLFDEIYAS